MAAVSPPSLMREEDYEAIESAVMETTRGRWFLSEYARRNRSADTNILLDAIGKLEGMMRREHRVPKLERIQLDLADMQEAIQRTRREIAQIKTESSDGDRFAEASNELDAIVTQTEGATQDILHKAELVQELAWTLREQGVDEKVCDDIDAHTTDIFMACSFQDLTGQRTQKVVQVLRYLESRINEMMEIWDVQADELNVDPGPINPEEHRPDAHLLHGPQGEDKAIKQNTVDELMDAEARYMADDDMADADSASAETAAESADEAGVSEQIDIDAMDFAAIDTSDAAEEAEPNEIEPETAAEPEAAAVVTEDDPQDDAELTAVNPSADAEDGGFDINDISFDKIDMGDEEAEADAMEATVADEAAADETGEEETAGDELPKDLAGAGNVLEDMLDADTDDEFAALEVDPQEPFDAADENAGLESDEDEEDADQAFLDAEASAEEEDDAADPLRALSTGERLALFN
ncbi:protein phosphatase CheZ [Breoghania sp. JC706]|uniref:protein phosphatase CheZ n=1 Tax=Breoghania sp. JC706 TaxID=3117732 RepID=UPI0030091CD2